MTNTAAAAASSHALALNLRVLVPSGVVIVSSTRQGSAPASSNSTLATTRSRVVPRVGTSSGSVGSRAWSRSSSTSRVGQASEACQSKTSSTGSAGR